MRWKRYIYRRGRWSGKKWMTGCWWWRRNCRRRKNMKEEMRRRAMKRRIGWKGGRGTTYMEDEVVKRDDWVPVLVDKKLKEKEHEAREEEKAKERKEEKAKERKEEKAKERKEEKDGVMVLRIYQGRGDGEKKKWKDKISRG